MGDCRVSKEMAELMRQLAELAALIGEKKGKIEALEKENEFLRELLKEKLSETR